MTRFPLLSLRRAAFYGAFLSCAVALPFVACKPHASGSPDSGARDAATPAPVATGLPAPYDVAAPPADAVKSATGLATKVLSPGTGTDHPGINDTVKVDYTGWTTDGKMFDSSVAPKAPGRKPEPARLTLTRVIPGWTEGIQLMVTGEKRRMWIPEDIAYAGRPGAPKGMLVFDVELLDITPGPKPPSDVAAAPEGAEKLKDGLATKVTEPGTGKVHPHSNDGVKVKYSLWKRDGRLLDESKEGPVARPVSGFFEGWEEGLQLMVVGEKRTLWIPAALSMKPRPGGPPPSDVTALIELTDIIPGPKTPPDVKAPPKDAIVEKDGLASKILAKGTGTVHPTKANSVTVQYAGWTTDGKLFDSSYTRGEPATFGVGSVIPGWTEALLLMVEGEKRRLWIPAELAYKNQPQAPQGMLVFDVELQKISAAPQMPVRPRPMLGGGPGGMGRPGMNGPGMMARPGGLVRPPGMGGGQMPPMGGPPPHP